MGVYNPSIYQFSERTWSLHKKEYKFCFTISLKALNIYIETLAVGSEEYL